MNVGIALLNSASLSVNVKMKETKNFSVFLNTATWNVFPMTGNAQNIRLFWRWYHKVFTGSIFCANIYLLFWGIWVGSGSAFHKLTHPFQVQKQILRREGEKAPVCWVRGLRAQVFWYKSSQGWKLSRVKPPIILPWFYLQVGRQALGEKNELMHHGFGELCECRIGSQTPILFWVNGILPLTRLSCATWNSPTH